MEFRREANRNYMVLYPEPGKRSRYTVRMLDKNQVSGLLAFHEKLVDGKCGYYYDITSRQPLGRILETRAISGEELSRLLGELVLVLKQLERYLLDADELCLKPETIYVEPDSFRSFWCMIPGESHAFPDSFQEFSQYLLDHVNHDDQRAVVLAFGVFKQSRRENFGIADIEKELGRYPEKRRQLPENRISGDGSEKSGIQEDPVRSRGTFFSEPGSLYLSDRQEEEDATEVRREETFLTASAQRSRKGASFREKKASEISEDADTREAADDEGAEVRLAGALPGVILLLVAVLVLAAVWFVPALYGFRAYGIRIAVGGFLAAAAVFLLGSRKEILGTIQKEHREKEEYEREQERQEIEILFREEEEEKPSGTVREEEDDGEMHTMLLSSRPVETAAHALLPLDGGERIPIRYFPFLIGKNRSICDFCPEAAGVSRLHVKIEETAAGEYTVTDLNSTNGTYINGTLLPANGSGPLCPGDEIRIASLRYRFVAGA